MWVQSKGRLWYNPLKVYQNKQNYHLPGDILEKAAKLVKDGYSLWKAAEAFGIDMTFEIYLKKKDDPDCRVGYGSTSIKNRIILPNMEKDSVDLIA